MNVQQQYYSTKEVARLLSVSKTTANQIMHMFEYRGQLFRYGNTLRVEIKVFNEWVDQQKRIGGIQNGQ